LPVCFVGGCVVPELGVAVFMPVADDWVIALGVAAFVVAAAGAVPIG
jgi:hypothetical protein